MRNSLSWLLALLLCWQALSATAGIATMAPGHATATVAAHAEDCGHAPSDHCPQSRHPAAGACADHCQHCPGPIAYLPARGTLLPPPAASDPSPLVRVLAPVHPPTSIYRPPITA